MLPFPFSWPIYINACTYHRHACTYHIYTQTYRHIHIYTQRFHIYYRFFIEMKQAVSVFLHLNFFILHNHFQFHFFEMTWFPLSAWLHIIPLCICTTFSSFISWGPRTDKKENTSSAPAFISLYFLSEDAVWLAAYTSVPRTIMKNCVLKLWTKIIPPFHKLQMSDVLSQHENTQRLHCVMIFLEETGV